MGPIMSLHVCLGLKNRSACMMAALYSYDSMHLSSMLEKLLWQTSLEGATLLKAALLIFWFDVVGLHVSLKQTTKVKLLTTGGARIDVTADITPCLFCMYARQVAADRILLHSRILTEVALVYLLTCFAEPMYA